jgi:hypothetical protein
LTSETRRLLRSAIDKRRRELLAAEPDTTDADYELFAEDRERFPRSPA